MKVLTQIKDLTIESLKDNKKLIIGLYILFIICFITSWILSDNMVNNIITTTSGINTSTNYLASDSTVNVMELLIHNELGGITTYITSIFFGIPAIITLIYNGAQLGMFGKIFSTFYPNGGLRYIIYLLPHGIFEITATVLQSVAGVLLFYFIWKFIKTMISDENNGFRDSFDKTKKILIQSIVIFIFSVVLLIIAAPIEAYFSIPFSDFIMGIL